MLPTDDKGPRRTPTHQQREPFLPLTLVTLSAPLLWVLHFAIVYLLEGFLCAPARTSPTLITGIILMVTLLCGGACIGLLRGGAAWLAKAGSSRLESHQFLATSQRMLAALALTAIVWGGAGALFVAPCSVAY